MLISRFQPHLTTFTFMGFWNPNEWLYWKAVIYDDDDDDSCQEQQRSTLVKWRQAGGAGKSLILLVTVTTMTMMMMMVMMVMMMTSSWSSWHVCDDDDCVVEDANGNEDMDIYHDKDHHQKWSKLPMIKIIKIIIPITDSCGHWSHLWGWEGDSDRTEQVFATLEALHFTPVSWSYAGSEFQTSVASKLVRPILYFKKIDWPFWVKATREGVKYHFADFVR